MTIINNHGYKIGDEVRCLDYPKITGIVYNIRKDGLYLKDVKNWSTTQGFIFFHRAELAISLSMNMEDWL